MNDTLAIGAVVATAMQAGTPLLLTALGELVTEKSGVLNLGLEGMMLVGAVAGFAATLVSGSVVAGLLAAMLAAMTLAALFALLTLKLMSSQVATGLALTIFGVGLSAFLGAGYVGVPLQPLPRLSVPLLSELPLLGPALFRHDALVYLSLALFAAITWLLRRTRVGLVLRAVGENPEAARAIGYRVTAIRFLAVLFGGAMCGLGGAYLSIAYTPMWVENMSAGRGWIALALVVFATWKPERVLLGAYLFGGVTILQLHIQGAGMDIPVNLLSALPYLATIAVLILISRNALRVRLSAPAALGKPFHPES